MAHYKTSLRMVGSHLIQCHGMAIFEMGLGLGGKSHMDGYRFVILRSQFIDGAIDLVGNVRFTFDERVNVGAFSFEEGSTSLSGEMALALIRYGNAQTHREEYAAQVMRSICERLSLNDGEEAYAKICARVSTSFTKSDFAERNGLISSYGQMKKSTVELCGTYRGDGEAHYFVSDVEATLDLFSKYRKIYN